MTLSLVAVTLLGGSEVRSRNRRKLKTGSDENDTDTRDDHFRRVRDADDLIMSADQSQSRARSNYKFDTPEDLAEIPADELALIVRSPNDPRSIDFSHATFNHPRRYWDKILTSSNMKDVSNVELFKLQMLYPGTSFDQDHN